MEEIRTKAYIKRLENEFDRMTQLPRSVLYEWEPAPDEQVPVVGSYLVTYYVHTIAKDHENDRLVWQDETGIEITKDSIENGWRARVYRGLTPFHPQWWQSGWFDAGMIGSDPGMWLCDFINLVGESLRFRADMIDTASPANPAAAAFWQQHRDDKDILGNAFFPTDGRPFIDPARCFLGMQPEPEAPAANRIKPLNLTFALPDDTYINVDVEPETVIWDAFRQMVEAEVIKPLTEAELLRVCRPEGKELDVGLTFAECGVEDGATLYIYRMRRNKLPYAEEAESRSWDPTPARQRPPAGVRKPTRPSRAEAIDRLSFSFRDYFELSIEAAQARLTLADAWDRLKKKYFFVPLPELDEIAFVDAGGSRLNSADTLSRLHIGSGDVLSVIWDGDDDE